jgi:hypothetical protein
MFASPGEMRVEARRHGIRVNLPKASWNENVDEILKKTGALPRKLVVERVPSPPVVKPEISLTLAENTEQNNSEDLRVPSPIQAETECSTPRRPNRPRSSASRQSSELRGAMPTTPPAASEASRDSFVNTRQTIVKFQLFS